MIHVILINNVINIVQTASCHTLAIIRELGPWLDKLGFFYFSADCKAFLKAIGYCYATVRTVGERVREREREREREKEREKRETWSPLIIPLPLRIGPMYL